MDWLREVSEDDELKESLVCFLDQYGKRGLEEAIRTYSDSQREYICRTKTSVSKIKISDILYLKIEGHSISIFTEKRTYFKYGSLTHELGEFAPHGFIKCNQSTIIALDKIKAIEQNEVVLEDGTSLHMSRSCTPKVIAAFTLGKS